ncbi:MAG: hypothetical protein ACR2G6_05850 [Gemmatimonadaceae bacterium]
MQYVEYGVDIVVHDFLSAHPGATKAEVLANTFRQVRTSWKEHMDDVDAALALLLERKLILDEPKGRFHRYRVPSASEKQAWGEVEPGDADEKEKITATEKSEIAAARWGVPVDNVLSRGSGPAPLKPGETPF